ncbi:formin-like protein 6 isoform X3 [Juglans microcarpa x Juglans regia]|nr:formin-like protein 6 isoform X3 [Juglans microcarpa x Juglans regia]
MMFRVMFNTAFIQSNILIINRDEIDILWTCKDQFHKDFRAEVLLLEMDAATSLISINLPGIKEKEGLPVEAFAKVKEIYSNVDWLDPKADAALNVLQQIKTFTFLQERLETISLPTAEGSLLLDSTPENLTSELKASEQNNRNLTLMAQAKQSIPSLDSWLDSNSVRKKIEAPELQFTFQWPAKSKIISQRGPPTSLSAPAPASYSNSLQGSPVPISRYHSAPSALGITALLHDHAASNSEEVKHAVTVALTSTASSAPSISNLTKPVQLTNIPIPSKLTPPLPSFSIESSIDAPINIGNTSAAIPSLSVPLPISSAKDSSPTQHPGTTIQSSLPSPHPPPTSFAGASRFYALKSPRSMPPPPCPPFSGVSPSPSVNNSFSTPPSPFPPPSLSVTSPSSTIKNSFSNLPSSPPPLSGTAPSSLKTSFSGSHPPPPAIPSSHACDVHSAVCVKKNTAVTSAPPLPPPLPFSRPASGPTKLSSAPPSPPPPPNSALNDSSSKNSAHVLPVPPPPAPFSNGLTKAGRASPKLNSGATGVPPIPGPPSGSTFSSKGWGVSRANPKNQASAKKTNLKPYHWLKLTRAMQGSLWAEAQKADETSKAPDFDMSELESLFSAVVPNSVHGSTGGKSNCRASRSKLEKAQLIELRRAYNCEIMLTKVKLPLPELVSSVLALDESALDVDQVENLIKFCPTKEEIELLKGYVGDKENLGKCEQFFLELMKVPRVESKLRVFSFKIQFRAQVSDLRNNLNVVNSASEEIRNSVKLKRIMQTILSLGNALNHGTARGSAIGFRLDSLLKLTDTRAQNNKMTLMHYLCKVLAEKLPELLDFSKDLVNLEASTKIQLKYLAEEMQAISKGLEKVIQELTASENDGHVSNNFCKIIKEFLSYAEVEVRSLGSLYSSAGRNADALTLYFGEDPARCPFEQVVSTLLNFVRMFVRAHEENCKYIELEKKRAEKEKESEKLMLFTSKKEPVHIMRITIRNGNIN